jgi:hypothetical protein
MSLDCEDLCPPLTIRSQCPALRVIHPVPWTKVNLQFAHGISKHPKLAGISVSKALDANLNTRTACTIPQRIDPIQIDLSGFYAHAAHCILWATIVKPNWAPFAPQCLAEAVDAVVVEAVRSNGEYFCVVDRVGEAGTDEMTVMVEARDTTVDTQALKTDLERRMKKVLGVRALSLRRQPKLFESCK